ncbi:MAG: amidase, partial [Gaiellales bacterium]
MTDATAIIESVRRRETSAVEVAREHLRLIDQRDGGMGSVWEVTETRALREAEAVDRALASGNDPGPLAGAPVGWKDLIDTAGIRTTYGSAVYRDHVPEHDADVVARFAAAGAVCVAKLATHEFAWGTTSDNPHFGTCRNPHDPSRVPGGSSGGSGAALAAGLVALAPGTDTGGSIRCPASCCGVVGLRPTPGRVVCEITDAAGLSVVSPLGRSVADVRLLFSVMAQEPPPEAKGHPEGLRIGVADSTALGMDAACADALGHAVKALESAGHRLSPIRWESEAVAAGYGVVRRASMASFPADPQLFGPGIRGLVEQGRKLSALDYFQAFETATAAAYDVVVKPLVDDCDLLLTPTLGLPPMPIEAVPPF